MEQEIWEVFDKLPYRIREISSYQVKKDLKRMYQTCENLKRELVREQVNCRNGRDSYALLQLRNKFAESVTNLDQYVTLALLSI